MRANEIITELFDTRGIQWESPTKARFEVNGIQFISVFKQDLGGGNHFDFSFLQEKPDGGEVKQTFNNTGETGSASARVFGLALQSVEEFIARRHPGSISFTGLANDGRDKLYARMIRVLGPKLAANGYDVSTKPVGPYSASHVGPGTTWTLSRNASHNMPAPEPINPEEPKPDTRTPEQKQRDAAEIAALLDELGLD